MSHPTSMPAFIARCLEEIGLEGRCGLPVRDLFQLVDPCHDVVFRRYAWGVLRGMTQQLAFYHMVRVPAMTLPQAAKARHQAQRRQGSPHATTGAAAAATATAPGRKRKRKWVTTLITPPVSDEDDAAHAATTKHRKKSARTAKQLQRENKKTQGKQRRHSDASGEAPLKIKQERRGSIENDGRERDEEEKDQSDQSDQSDVAIDDELRQQWKMRSPRGYELDEPVAVDKLSYEDAVSDTGDGVLGIVACAELRLQLLGVVDPTQLDPNGPAFDLLEIVGRSRTHGANAAELAHSQLFGDARKLHYVLDVLLASRLVEKNIVISEHRRFNMVHLTRFAPAFDPNVVSDGAALEKDGIPKHILPDVIAHALRARGQTTCVFADIGRELGYDKRGQEKLRNFFWLEARSKPDFPLELFMARCNTNMETQGRKLWCVRLRQPGAGDRGDGCDDDADVPMGPVLERGLMEQVYAVLQHRRHRGATIPEIRDLLGVPTFKLPYKLAQGLIAHYPLRVEQVVNGKCTMYRMYVPGQQEQPATNATTGAESGITNEAQDNHEDNGRATESIEKNKEASTSVSTVQPTTLKEATRGVLFAQAHERRQAFVLEYVTEHEIVSIHRLRAALDDAERAARGVGVREAGKVDLRSVQRIISDFEANQQLATLDISLPAKKVLQKTLRVVKCVAVPAAQHNRTAIKAFIKRYMQEQERMRHQSVEGANEHFIVLSERTRYSRPLGPEHESKEVINYAQTAFKNARDKLIALQRQSRRLGAFFGIVYRCRAFHLLLWERIDVLRSNDTSRLPTPKAKSNKSSSPNGDGTNQCDHQNDVVFSLREVLDQLDPKTFVHLVGVNELLTEQEEQHVRMCMVRGDGWDALTPAARAKVRSGENERFFRLLRVLIELGLVEMAGHTPSHDFLSIFRTSDDVDTLVSQFAHATLSGGFFRLKREVHIAVCRGTRALRQLPGNSSYVYAAGFSSRSKSEHFSGRIPLEFTLEDVEQAKEYWKALRFLSLEGARLGTTAQNDTSVTIQMDGEVVRPMPLRDHHLYSMKVWVPRSTSTTSTRTKEEMAAETANSVRALKRKRFSNAKTTTAKERQTKRQRVGLHFADVRSLSSRERMLNPLINAKLSVRASQWTLEDDSKLLDSYLERCSVQWFIDVPLALQRQGERVAFRNASLTRSKISWKGLAREINKKPQDCLLRVKELLVLPEVKLRLQNARESITQNRNPGGRFHEEWVVLTQPRMAALLTRALQIIFHARTSYYSVLADSLISHWKEAEVKLVWRYLWLSGVITRTSKRNEGKNQKQRGFCVHSAVHEMKSLQIPNYPLALFGEAAEYCTFREQNASEAADEDEQREDDGREHEFGVNAPAGHCAVELAAMAMGVADLRPEYVAPTEKPIEGSDGKKSAAIKGLAGHLAQQHAGSAPDDFLRDFWFVKSRYHTQDTPSVRELEAFSMAEVPVLERPSRLPLSDTVQSWLLTALEAAGSDGLTLEELQNYCESECASVQVESASVRWSISSQLSRLVRRGEALLVQAYAHPRYVAEQFKAIWVVHPYRIAEDQGAANANLRFVFDKDQTVVAKPWLHLDGSANTAVAVALKRKVVNIVMCCPGISDRDLHVKMRKVMSLQHTNDLVQELITQGVLYARTATHASPPTSIFAISNRAKCVVNVVAPDELLVHNRLASTQLHYFPSVNCVERFGALVTDVD